MDHSHQRRASPHQRRARLQVHQVHVPKPDIQPSPVKRAEETCLPGQRHCREISDPRPTSPVDRPNKEDWWTIFYPTIEDPTSTPGTLPLPTPSVVVVTLPSSISLSSSIRSSPTSSSSSSSSTTFTAPSTTLSRSTTIHVVTQTAPSAVNATASTSASATPTGATQTGTIIGGIGGGLIGIALICALVSFFFRRWRKRKQDEDPFNSAQFRRSAVLLQDPPTHADTINAGFNPRPPPSMVERRPLTFGTIYGSSTVQQSPVTPIHDQHYGQYEPTSAHPLYSAPQQPNPIATVASNPFSSPTRGYQDGSSPMGETPVARSPSSGSVLTRQSSKKTANSIGIPAEEESIQYAAYPSPTLPASLPTTDYVDLSRSSVSPFQAAQYAEISKQIGSEPPSGLTTLAVATHLEKAMPPLPGRDRSSLTPSTKSRPASLDTIKASAANASPFEDPVLAQVGASRFSAASSMDGYGEDEGQVLEFPAPPTPAVTTAPAVFRRPTHSRIDSKPPTLPEITVNVDRASRSSFATSLGLSPFNSSIQQQTQDFPSSAVSSSFPNSVPASPGTPGTPSQFITVPAKNSTFPVTPSPLNASFTLPSPTQSDMGAPGAVSAPQKPAISKRETVYDPDDVYGGI